MSIDSAISDQIKQFAFELGVGDGVSSLVCPFCDGGPHREKSFAVKRFPDVLFYQCFRATCVEKGIIPTSLCEFTIRRKPKKIMEYYGTSSPLTDEDKAYIEDLWGILPEELSSQGFTKDDDSGDLVMPLFTIEGYDAGCILRRMDGRKPKTLTFWQQDVPTIHFPRRASLTRSVVLVEDIPSAIRASKYLSSAALLGTHMSEDVVVLLKKHFDTVYLALDNDALKKAFLLLDKYKLSFGNFFVLPLSNDIKNMKEEAVQELLGGLIGKTAIS
jgi:hypothetical protein